jgi:hypothetical protein
VAIAAQGSSAAPDLPDSFARDIAAGAASVPLRPMNSARSQVSVRLVSSMAKNATRSPNSVPYALRAKSAPVSPSFSVTMCIADFARRSPSTHST